MERYHFIKDLVQKKEIMLKFCRTHEQIDDLFTKGVAKAQFLRLRDSPFSPLSIKWEYVGNVMLIEKWKDKSNSHTCEL